jgi:ABC-2 type transport system ATP-binding protein
VQADADIMLIDEVLAVGDAAFAQRCMDVFREKRRAGRTIVLVTHDMTTVQTLCHRAMLLHDGELRFIGGPEDAALAYYRMNFAAVESQLTAAAPVPGDKVVDVNARVVRAALERDPLAQGDPIVLDVTLEAARPLARPIFNFHVRNADGLTVFELMRTLDADIAPGRRVRLAGPVENRLVPGRYSLDVYIREDAGRDVTVQGLRLLHFDVTGTAIDHGVVTARADLEAELEP